jgi:hypothetical protein
MSAPDRRALLDREHPKLSVRRRCVLLSLARSGVYRAPPARNDSDLTLPAGSSTSTIAASAAAASINERLVRLPTSSSGVSRSAIGRGVGTRWRRMERGTWKPRKLPAFMS